MEVAHPLTDTETRILRKLVQVLRDGIDDKDFTNGKEHLSALAIKNLPALRDSCKMHSSLFQHVRSLLNALGGSHRTVMALEQMHNRFGKLSHSWTYFPEKDRCDLYPRDCLNALSSLSETVDQMGEAFKEFGLFNTELFEVLGAIEKTSKGLMNIIKAEYVGPDNEKSGNPFLSFQPISVDGGFDSMFEPLVKNLERYVQILTSIAEKEIPAMRQTQELTNQQYVNLTSIATFLSSVTATTLQISTSDSAPDSVLTTVTNSFWFVSLVFSAASAVYSLLAMTWRRSPIRQPDQSLSGTALFWLRNGPMVALIIALITFSIGLCLLAFLTSNQRGGVAPAAVPTAFAGAHAQAILFLSACYLFEYWSTRHPKSLNKFQDSAIIRCAAWVYTNISSTPGGAKTALHLLVKCGTRLKNQFTILVDLVGSLRVSVSNARLHADLELEIGVPPSINLPDYDSLSFNADHHITELDGNPSIESEFDADLDSPTDFEAIPANITGSSSRSTESESLSEFRSSRPGDLLQFSSDCTLLASAFKNSITIYSVDDSFRPVTTITVPDGGHAQQILWRPDTGYEWGVTKKERRLLVRSASHAYIYDLSTSSQSHVLTIEGLDMSISPMRWICKKHNGMDGLSCLMGKSLKIFASPSVHNPSDDSIVNIENYSCTVTEVYDLSGLKDCRFILDASLYGEDEIVCLVKTEGEEFKLLVVDKTTKSVKQTHNIFPLISKASLTVCQESGKAFVHGEKWTDIFELVDKSGLVLLQTRAAGHFGENSSMIYDIQDEQISIYYSPSLSRLHAITTPSSSALCPDFESFAIGHNPEDSRPYLFAFGGGDGSVKIWSIQSNHTLDKCESAELFKVHDRLDNDSDPVIMTGRFLTLELVRVQIDGEETDAPRE